MKKNRRYSVTSLIILVFAIVACMMFTVNILTGFQAINVTESKISDGVREALAAYSSDLESSIKAIDGYLASNAFDSSAATLKNLGRVDQKSTAFYAKLSVLKAEMDSMRSSLDCIDGIFAYIPDSNDYIYSSNSVNDAAISEIRSSLRAAKSTNSLEQYPAKGWHVCSFGEKYYLMRVMRIGENYIGAWIKTDSIFEKFEIYSYLVSSVVFIDQNGKAYDSVSGERLLDSSICVDAHGFTEFRDGGKKYMGISLASSYIQNGSYFMMIVPSDNLFTLLGQNYILLAISSALIILIIIAALVLISKYFNRPMRQLKHSINALREGDFSTRVETDTFFTEFSDINSAFNDMVEEIHSLKISVYEEKLHQQMTEIKYLKTQIAPHFLINCLNLIYHLAEKGDKEQLQTMCVDLGDHLRYALSDRRTVPIEAELKMAENYIAISKIRFPGCIEIHYDLSEDIYDAAILPMLLIVLVENTVKYEVVAGELTKIHVKVNSYMKDDRKFVHICQWDTGEGFGKEALNTLRTVGYIQDDNGHNIGIRNMYQRMKLIYGDDFGMSFSNRERAGAQIDIDFPYVSQQGGNA